MGNRYYIRFGNIWVHPWFFGELRETHHVCFVCYVFLLSICVSWRRMWKIMNDNGPNSIKHICFATQFIFGLFLWLITFRTSSTSFSHNLISLIWFVACDKLGILLLESSISDCFEKYILNKLALSILSNIKLSLWRIGGILISDPFIPEICLTMFHQFLQLLYLSLAFLTRLIMHGVIKMFSRSVNSIFLPYHFTHITR
jgi:hypothetical protein